MTSPTVRERWLAGSKLGGGTLFPEDRHRIKRSWIIVKLVSENPKRGVARERFALYRNGTTVEDYIGAVIFHGGEERVALEDVCWDLNHEFIELREPTKPWSVAEAKAKLSEILRLARAGEPQRIGTDEACVVVSAEQFEHHLRPDHLCRFLIESAPRGYELELPSRASRRGDPFAFEEDGRSE
jgi:prevent-host-death family protein